ncbi:hypothetical protein BXU06_04260 [Aquaspirillum sp. LM1]|uniref:hypothetical protein n=1 Tax=Aquaspirillum sp. LM1 TaxID=1938604 RepID=UPI0009838D37|nr:hypothetical protein [Aquaspirillum sp. LM1]AQR64359.1 hypothetical protein BXU06_04260 [Aquaspirillum sp. LM1]
MQIDIGSLLSSYPSNPNYVGSPEQLATKAELDKFYKESPNAGFSFTFDPALANTTHNNIRYMLLPKPTEEEKIAFLKMKQQFEELLKSDEEVKKKLESPEVLEKFFSQEADSIFRSPAGEILAVVYKDGSIYSHGGVNLDAIHQAGQGLSQHEYRAMARNAVATALGSQAVASYYDYHKPAPTLRDISLEEKAYYRRA